ncbi:MAG: aspartate-semialdehyde dehydrogenase [Alphaproteobacteria bacterium]|jgi:aspartate-semialdehyde dehydrogenase|nr:aspartate-semialdehyde dehydrogenase [Alphaproteobacteria bacterium]
MSVKIAVIGATGNVGREIVQILAERGFSKKNVFVLASENSVGAQISYGENEDISVDSLSSFDFSKVNIVLASAGSKVISQYADKITKSGAILIDNSSHFRVDSDIPLIVPEVNPGALSLYKKKKIIANPNCVVAMLVLALKPLHDAAKIKRVVISTYQSVSGAGRAAMDELFNQTRGIYMNQEMTKEQFTKQIAFNVIPHIDQFMDDGGTKEEWKIMVEIKKIVDPKIKVSVTSVRVPVFVGHAMSANIEFENEISAEQARKFLKSAPGVSVVDRKSDDGYVTPQECVGEDLVYVSRIREDSTVDNGLNLWVVSDNLRKGAALNAVQIAELLIKEAF